MMTQTPGTPQPGTRSLEWASFEAAGFHSGVCADVAGTQHENGDVEAYVLVWGENKELNAAQARALAAALNAAADRLENLEERQ